jgi:hypothetical protein
MQIPVIYPIREAVSELSDIRKLDIIVTDLVTVPDFHIPDGPPVDFVRRDGLSSDYIF